MPRDKYYVAREGEHQKEVPRVPSASDGFLIPVSGYAGSFQLNLLVLTSIGQTLCGEGEKSTTMSGLLPGRYQSSWYYHEASSFCPYERLS